MGRVIEDYGLLDPVFQGIWTAISVDNMKKEMDR